MADQVSKIHTCQVCNTPEQLRTCSECRTVWYCSREHQRSDWKVHKTNCKMSVTHRKENTNLIAEKIAEETGRLQIGKTKLPNNPQWGAANSVTMETFSNDEITEKDRQMSNNIWKSMQQHGLCMLDKFLPEEQAEQVLSDVTQLYRSKDCFSDGEIVKQGSNLGPERVRGDRVKWIDETFQECKAIQFVTRKLDKMVHLCSTLGHCRIVSRTKPMVACYPGNGTFYKCHIDNPAEDGRCITCLYYLNKNWNAKENGGELCLYPKGTKRKILCEPQFNRLMMFFSNDRNPHEVLPAYKERFAITCWYFDHDERLKALAQWAQKQNSLVKT
uniref:egl nine homolog 1 n=1 Tax=Ciona intestinalis TaxID=7719 RepID=UPI00006A7584|nr:egl nine homolog 1 [Ciona intestinalis]|eukprot:XP_002127497.1 egl nine homolog 1 [Ciona intestinalis]